MSYNAPHTPWDAPPEYLERHRDAVPPPGHPASAKKFDWQTNDRLRRALELKLFEDQKDSIKLKTLVSAVVDRETQEKIDIIKARLIRYFGYNEVSATDVLNYVASIFARGDAKG